ncbi:MAG TPA: sugar ABC transporter substrate-binding protein [Candidatus Binatia bacterium]|nr:sugar ABC transporter substrate-binding protein [Candidatus Binatia bacterium]
MSPSPRSSRSSGRRWASWGRLALAGAAALAVAAAGAAERRPQVAFANLTEEPGVTLEGTGFTGRDVREGFELAARRYPVDMVFYDNGRDGGRALANAEDAVARKVDVYIQYFPDPEVNRRVADRLRAAGIPVLAINYPVPGAPLYTADNLAAGRIAGEALGRFAAEHWRGQPVVAVLVGSVGDEIARVTERARGVREGLARLLPGVRVAALDTRGNPGQVGPLLGRFAAAHPGAKILVAAMDDASALAAKAALEAVGRARDAAIVSHGVDRSIHGGMNDRKELDPNNRGSIVLGSVAFFLDRYGEDVLPLALRLLRGESVPARTATEHRLITHATIFREYPPYDMN